jgi:hypothetical protein
LEAETVTVICGSEATNLREELALQVELEAG